MNWFMRFIDTLTPSCNEGIGMKLLFLVVVIQSILRLAAEILTRIAVKTNNTWDNKIAKVLGQVAWHLGVFLGVFGLGTPVEVIQKQIDATKINPK